MCANESSPERLRRSLKLGDIVALGINGVVGTGIFLLPGQIAYLAGGRAWLAYVACAALCFLIALCFAEMGSRYEKTGGAYVYAIDAFGPFVGFLVGWIVWLSALAGWASVAVGLVNSVPLPIGGTALAWAHFGMLIGCVGLLAFLNVRGARLGALANDLFSAAKLLPLGLFVVLGLFHMKASPFAAPAHCNGKGDLIALMLMTVYLYSGFEDMPVPAGETRDPQTTMPRALFIVLGVATVIYVVVHLVAQGVFLGLADAKMTPLADAAGFFMGAGGLTLVACGAVISQFGTTASIALTGPRSLYALARDRFIPALFADIHPRFHTPTRAIVCTALLVIAFKVVDFLNLKSLNFDRLVALSALGSLLQYIATCGAVIVMRFRSNAPKPRVRLAGGPLIPVLALAVCTILVVYSPLEDAKNTLIGVSLGIPLYLARHAWRRPSESSTADP